ARGARFREWGGRAVRLIIEPAGGVAPLLSAIKRAKKSVEVAIFRLDRKDIEAALVAAAARGVRVTTLIAFANRGGEQRLRQLELRCLAAGIIVARTADDLIRYHGKYILIDRRILYVLSFNFTTLDIEHSRGFGVFTSRPDCLQEAVNLFTADCTRTPYAPKIEKFVVSPANSRHVLGTFLKRARTQLLIYDPRISDREMLGILHGRAKAGVDVKVIGQVAGRPSFEAQKLAGLRLHTRTIIRDRRQAFVGSQSLRPAELDSRREVGLIVSAPKAVKQLIATFEADWARTTTKAVPIPPEPADAPIEQPAAASAADVAKAVGVFTHELESLASTVKDAVRQAVVKAGDDVLHDKDVKDTMKQVVKQAVKEAVKDAVHEAQDAAPPRRIE
ncbi:MAG: phospholipase D-like domain-containing protein, partial [Acidobacteria bacterium]|nr:phospholipase D-like domain-containing protein [Acidobacteriota bacterium]